MRVLLEKGNLCERETDLLALGVYEDEPLTERVSKLDHLLGGLISQVIKAEEFTGKKEECVILHTFGKIPAKRLLLLGLGKKEKVDANLLRNLGAMLIKKGRKVKAKEVVSELVGLNSLAQQVDYHNGLMALTEGVILSNYRFLGYGKKNDEAKNIEQIVFLTENLSPDMEEGYKCGLALGNGTTFARDLTNMPSNILTPTVLAEKGRELAQEYNFTYEILERSDMEKLQMGALLGVAKGSSEPPKLIVLKYQGLEDWKDVIAFVGKGLTFDAGGISLKPAENMDAMKMDMGGAAAVLGAMKAIGELRPKVNILAVIPALENMPDGASYKPGDVLTSMSGKTIEILNTDAEGRLALADAITYAIKLGAMKIIDLATLTGAVLVGLGKVTTGALTNKEEFFLEFNEVAKKEGEKIWLLPSFPEYKEQIKSQIADLKNTGGRNAGTITAGLFLGSFVDDEIPWLHLDIAGTAWSDKESLTEAKGATGVMVRSLARYTRFLSKKQMEKK